jgi:hypothetical protein
MRKINSFKILSAITLLVGVFISQSSGALAAAPACYYKNPQNKYAVVTCPSPTLKTATEAPSNKCYVSSDTDRDRPASSFSEAACTSIAAATDGTDTGTTDLTHGLGTINFDTQDTGHFCGRGPDQANGETSNQVHVSFDFGCLGDDPERYTGNSLNPIVDIAFAIFRFLSAGVGLVVIGSIVIAGIQYTASRGDPQATGAAIKRISNSLIGLLLYIFMFAIANFIVPGGMFL